MEESQFDPEEGTSSHNYQDQIVKTDLSSNFNEPSTSSKSPIRNEECENSTEDIR